MGRKDTIRRICLLLTAVGEVYANWCYWPDGSPAVNTVQCGAESWCCYTGDTCMSNGLCRDINNHINGTEPNLYQIESCVSKDWSGCMTNCLSPNSSDRAYLWACDNSLTTYCCAAMPLVQQDCCSAADITIAAAQVLNTATATVSSSTALVASTMSSVLAPTTTRAAETVSTTASSDQQSLSTGAKAGTGVGIAVAVLLIAGTVAACVLRRRSKMKGTWPDSGEPFQSQSYQEPADPTFAQEKHLVEVEAVETERRAELEELRSPVELGDDTGDNRQRLEQERIP